MPSALTLVGRPTRRTGEDRPRTGRDGWWRGNRACEVSPKAAGGILPSRLLADQSVDGAPGAGKSPPRRVGQRDPPSCGRSARAGGQTGDAGAMHAFLCLILLVGSLGTHWPLSPTPTVVHPFRLPSEAWGAGHRGVDLLGVVGQEVDAAAPARSPSRAGSPGSGSSWCPTAPRGPPTSRWRLRSPSGRSSRQAHPLASWSLPGATACPGRASTGVWSGEGTTSTR